MESFGSMLKRHQKCSKALQKALHEYAQAQAACGIAAEKLGTLFEEYGEGEFAYDRPIYQSISNAFTAHFEAVQGSFTQLEEVGELFSIEAETSLMGEFFKAATIARPPFIEQANSDFVVNAAVYEENRYLELQKAARLLSSFLIAEAAAGFETGSELQLSVKNVDIEAPVKDVARLYQHIDTGASIEDLLGVKPASPVPLTVQPEAEEFSRRVVDSSTQSIEKQKSGEFERLLKQGVSLEHRQKAKPESAPQPLTKQLPVERDPVAISPEVNDDDIFVVPAVQQKSPDINLQIEKLNEGERLVEMAASSVVSSEIPAQSFVQPASLSQPIQSQNANELAAQLALLQEMMKQQQLEENVETQQQQQIIENQYPQQLQEPVQETEQPQLITEPPLEQTFQQPAVVAQPQEPIQQQEAPTEEVEQQAPQNEVQEVEEPQVTGQEEFKPPVEDSMTLSLQFQQPVVSSKQEDSMIISVAPQQTDTPPKPSPVKEEPKPEQPKMVHIQNKEPEELKPPRKDPYAQAAPKQKKPKFTIDVDIGLDEPTKKTTTKKKFDPDAFF